MASSGWVADFGRRPPLVKIGIILLIGALLGGLYYQFFYSKLKRDLDAAEAHAQDLDGQSKKLTVDEKEADELAKQLEQLKNTIKDNDSALPTAAELPAFFDTLNRKVVEAGVEVRMWDYQSQIPVDETIDKVPVQVEIQGTFYQIEKFFYLLYKMNQKEGDEGTGGGSGSASGAAAGAGGNDANDRILTIENLHIGSPTVKNQQLVLNATFRASTFRKEEPPPAETTAPAKPAAGTGTGTGSGTGSGSGTGTASGSGSAPSGMTGLPAKAKEKTEDAMQKDDQRAHSGPGGDGTGSSSGADRVKGGM